MDKTNEKVNFGCIKIFTLLSYLYENKAYYDDILEIFKDASNEQSKNNLQVLLNKNLNTLKIFGLKIKKQKDKYLLDSNLFAMNFTLEDLRSLIILQNSAKNFPDNECCKHIENFIKNFTFRMSNENRYALDNLSNNYNFTFYYQDLKDQIEECQEACKSNQQYEITFIKNKNTTTKCKCTPKEVFYDSRTAYLKVYDINKAVNIEIALPNILKLQELHQVKNPIEMPTTVVYKLKGRLAKTYKLKENERTNGLEPDGTRIVINTNEPFDKLKARLLRYSLNCEIISPKSLRNEMIDLINNMLKNYDIQ